MGQRGKRRMGEATIAGIVSPYYSAPIIGQRFLSGGLAGGPSLRRKAKFMTKVCPGFGRRRDGGKLNHPVENAIRRAAGLNCGPRRAYNFGPGRAVRWSVPYRRVPPVRWDGIRDFD